MYPVEEIVETIGTHVQNVKNELTGKYYETAPCVQRELRPFFVSCANCGKYMSKTEINYEGFRKNSYVWLADKSQEIDNTYHDMLKDIKKINTQISEENEDRTEDKQKPEWTPETLLEKKVNQLDEAVTHGRENWLKNQLREKIKSKHSIKCMECRS